MITADLWQPIGDPPRRTENLSDICVARSEIPRELRAFVFPVPERHGFNAKRSAPWGLASMHQRGTYRVHRRDLALSRTYGRRQVDAQVPMINRRRVITNYAIIAKIAPRYLRYWRSRLGAFARDATRRRNRAPRSRIIAIKNSARSRGRPSFPRRSRSDRGQRAYFRVGAKFGTLAFQKGVCRRERASTRGHSRARGGPGSLYYIIM